MSSPRLVATTLLLGLLALPADANPLPDLHGLRERLARAEALSGKTRHTGRVAMRLQNELTHRIYNRSLRCDEETGSLLARQRHLGHTYRDLLQAWRAEVDQLLQERELTVLAPLLQPEDHWRIRNLEHRLNEELDLWETTVSWQRSKVEPWAGACAATLAPDEGLPPWADHLPATRPALVIGVGPGRLCPAGVEADGAVVIVPDGQACVATQGCDCTPFPVTDGAVLSVDSRPPEPEVPEGDATDGDETASDDSDGSDEAAVDTPPSPPETP